jgi:arabinogalactan endo-1,4-beta-galactosidase
MPDRCRYAAQDDSDPTKWYCLKLSSKKAEIDDETKDFLKDAKKKGIDPKTAPLGDNCSGYPILKYKEQGYDKK